MSPSEPPIPEDYFADKAEGLPAIYLIYVVTPLLVLLIPLLVFAYIVQPAWPLALLITPLLAIITLILLVFIAARGPRWLVAVGFTLAGMVWGATILGRLPPAFAGGFLLLGAILLLLTLIAILLRRLRTVLILVVVLVTLIGNALVLLGMIRRDISLPMGITIYGSEALLLLFLLGSIFFLGGYVLPFPPIDPRLRKGRLRLLFQNHWMGGKTLLGYITGWHYPYWVMTREPREEDKLEQRGEGDALALLAIGPGLIISDCDHAVAVSDGIRFKGVQGPGLIFTSFADRPMRTLDLRPQLRTVTVQGLTRDGIQVKVLAFVPFQIDRGEQQPRLGEPFPYRKNAGFRAVHAQMMELPGTPDHPQHSWDELPTLLAARILQDILAQYNFDDFYRYDPSEEPPRVRIAREFRERLRAELEPLGIQLIGGGISNLLPVKEEEVLKERVRNWQAEWVRRILIRQAEGQRERLWRIEQARAEAQAQLILALGDQLAKLDRPDTPVTPDKIVDEFLKVLKEMTQQPLMRRYLPQETSDELQRLSGASKEASQ